MDVRVCGVVVRVYDVVVRVYDVVVRIYDVDVRVYAFVPNLCTYRYSNIIRLFLHYHNITLRVYVSKCEL